MLPRLTKGGSRGKQVLSYDTLSEPGMKRAVSLLLVTVAVLWAGCSTKGADEGKTVVSYTRWGDPAELESTRELIKQFMDENPDIIVRVDVVSWQQYWQKMATAVVTGTAQDVWLMSASYVEQYAAAGHLLDLMPFINADPTFNVDDYFPHAFDNFTYAGEGKATHNVPFGQGRLYSFTRDYNCSLLFYNKDHFDAAGAAYPTGDWTWEEMAAAAKKLTIDFDGDGIIDQWGLQGGAYTTLAAVIGGQIIDPETRRCSYSPRPGHTEIYDALVFTRDCIFKYKVAPPANIQIEEYAFVTGKTSMVIEGAWEIRNYNRSKSMWDIALVPLDRKDSKRTTGGGGVAHCVYSGTKHPDAAWKLVKFLSGDTSQRALGRSGTSIPVLKAAAYSDDFLADFDRPPKSSYPIIYSNLLGGKYVPSYTRGYLEYMKLSRQITGEVWLGVKTPEQACKEIDDETNAILAEQYGDAPL